MNKVSVITVVFNNVLSIERTILSVLSQNYLNFEYIIIDGGSTDGTLDIINKYRTKVDVVISERDNGIYDAMNKGAQLATGEWVNFMNSGDEFYSSTVLSEIFLGSIDLSNFSVLYGQVLLSLSYGTFRVIPEELGVINSRLPFCHQSSFVKRKELLNNLFDLSLKIVADHNLFYQLYKSGSVFYYFPSIVSKYFAEGGFSTKNVLIAFKESSKLTHSNIGIQYYVRLYLMAIRLSFTKILPQYILIKIRKRKYSLSFIEEL